MPPPPSEQLTLFTTLRPAQVLPIILLLFSGIAALSLRVLRKSGTAPARTTPG